MIANASRFVLDLLVRWWRASVQTARLAIGIPDYGVYVEHVRRAHPDRAPMMLPSGILSRRRHMEASPVV